MPALIYLAGRYTLMAYANGGVFALYFDFFKGLFELRPSCWIVVVGPFVFLSLVPVVPADPAQVISKSVRGET